MRFHGLPRAVLFLAVVGVCVLGTRPGLVRGDDLLGPDTDKVVTPGEIEQKIAALEPKVPLTSNDYRQQYELANLYYDQENYTKAEERYRRALELNPKYIEAMVNLGSVLSDLGRDEDAIDMFEKALAQDPEDCKARSNLGNAYYTLGRYPDAMYEYKRAIAIDADCYSAYFNIAVAFADAGIYREAVHWWNEVVQRAPGTSAARQAQENVELLKPFTEGPIPAPRR